MFEDLDPAARLTGRVAFGEEGVPGEDAAEEFPDVDEVEGGGWVGPGEVEVFDFEGAVGGHEEGLRGRQVGADYVGRGVCICHFSVRGLISALKQLNRGRRQIEKKKQREHT